MREEILAILNSAADTYNNIIINYSNVLPKNIIDGSHNSIEVEIPKFVNNFFSILNAVEGENKHTPIKNITEAIELFKKTQLDEEIDKALENLTIVGVGVQGNLNTKELLEACKYGIESGNQVLKMQLMAGKLSNGEGMNF